MRRLVLVLVFLLVAAGARAEVEIIQVGGGDRIEDAQGQIEANVVWLSRILPAYFDRVTNFFAGGDSEDKDVAYWSQEPVPSDMAPLARVFEGLKANQLVYRHNSLEHIDGPTTKAELTQALGDKLAAVPPGGEVFLIYNGHGNLSWPDVRDNYLRLWGRERLTVAEVDALFDKAPEDATIRFIFPQCYSGAFFNLVFENPRSETPAKQTRCGFFAQSAYLESEGCLLDINKSAFRDYTTYYFAPLYGKTRQDAPLPSNPDLDGDGRLSYREGHLYMLRNAESKDLSRSTSEAFLEDWQPWYLRWDTLTENRDSLYWELAETVAVRNGLSLDGPDLNALRQDLRKQWKALRAERKAFRRKIKETQRAMKKRIKRRWPELLHPYTEGYRRLLETELPAVTAHIEADPDYAGLSADQDRLIAVQQELLAMERRVAQVDKVVRFKKLARLEAQFERFASASEKEAYGRLLTCENGDFAPFNAGRAGQ